MAKLTKKGDWYYIGNEPISINREHAKRVMSARKRVEHKREMRKRGLF